MTGTTTRHNLGFSGEVARADENESLPIAKMCSSLATCFRAPFSYHLLQSVGPPRKGSCGGLGAVGIDKVCNCPEPCDARKKREAREAYREEKLAERQQKEAAWSKDRIA